MLPNCSVQLSSLLAILVTISACNSPTDATRANFKKAISEFVATAPESIEVDSFSSPQQIPRLGTAVKVKYHLSGDPMSSHELPLEAVLVLTDRGWRHPGVAQRIKAKAE